MELVGAALLHDDDGAAGRVAVLGGQNGGHDLGFLDGAEDRVGGVGAARLDAVHAVLEVADVAGRAAVDREAAERAGISQAARVHAGRQVEHGARVALIERHALEVLAIDDRARGGGLGFEEWERGGDLDGLGKGAQLHHGVDRQGRADAQLHVFADEVLKPGACTRTR